MPYIKINTQGMLSLSTLFGSPKFVVYSCICLDTGIYYTAKIRRGCVPVHNILMYLRKISVSSVNYTSECIYTICSQVGKKR